jgi:large subunit ribosomal protein L15
MNEKNISLANLSPAVPAEKAYRKGRGPGSGNGKTAGKGHKGQNARSGGGVRPGFEGGQFPIYRQLPKRGFNNYRFAKTYEIVKTGDLNRYEDGAEIDLSEKKILVGGEQLQKKLTVKASAFSAGAKAMIEAAGGSVVVVEEE